MTATEMTASVLFTCSSIIHWRRKWQPTPVLLPGKSQGQRSVVGYSPWGCKELDTTEGLHFYFLSSWITFVTVLPSQNTSKNAFIAP